MSRPGRWKRGGSPADAAADERVPVDGAAVRVLFALGRLLVPAAGWLGAQRPAFEAILLAKLRLDLRQGGLKNPNKPRPSGLLLTCGAYHLFGWFAGASVFLLRSPRGAAALVLGLAMVLLAMAIVNDLLDLLLSPADLTLLAPHPVSQRTLAVARVAHALLYVGLLGTAIAAPAWVLGMVAFGSWTWVVLFPVAALLAILFTLLAITVIFAWLLRVAHPDRVRDVVLWAQVTLAFLSFGGYYAVSGLVGREGARAWMAQEHPLQALLPPFWFATLATPSASAVALACMTCALLVPLLLAWLSARLAGEDLLHRMLALEAGGGPPVAPREGWMRRLGRLVTSPGLERAGWDTFLGLAARERQFRLRVYPMFAMPVMMMLYFWWTSHGRNRAATEMWLWVAYLPAIYSLSILHVLRFSDTPKAAWIHAAAPVDQFGLFVSGAVKALCCAMLLPWYLLLFGFVALVGARLSVLDLAFTVSAVLAFTLWCARLVAADALPFSRTFKTAQSGSQVLLFMLSMPLVIGLIVLQRTLSSRPEVMAGLAAGAMLLAWLGGRRLSRLRVSAVKLLAEE